MRWRPTLITALIVLSACSGSDRPIAADASTTTSSSPSTTSTTSSTTSSTTTTTTLAPTTTISVEDQVRADFTSVFDARDRCAYSPSTCEFAEIAAPGSEMDSYLRELMADRIAGNLRAVEGLGDVLWRMEDILVADSTASVVTCIFDTIILFDVQDPADPMDDIVFDDDAVSTRSRWEMELTPIGWRVTDVRVIEQRFEEDLCALSA